MSAFTYDVAGNLTSYTDPLGHREWYRCDKNNRLTGKTDRRGSEFTYEYDALGRLTASWQSVTMDRTARRQKQPSMPITKPDS